MERRGGERHEARGRKRTFSFLKQKVVRHINLNQDPEREVESRNSHITLLRLLRSRRKTRLSHSLSLSLSKSSILISQRAIKGKRHAQKKPTPAVFLFRFFLSCRFSFRNTVPEALPDARWFFLALKTAAWRKGCIGNETPRGVPLLKRCFWIFLW